MSPVIHNVSNGFTYIGSLASLDGPFYNKLALFLTDTSISHLSTSMHCLVCRLREGEETLQIPSGGAYALLSPCEEC